MKKLLLALSVVLSISTYSQTYYSREVQCFEENALSKSYVDFGKKATGVEVTFATNKPYVYTLYDGHLTEYQIVDAFITGTESNFTIKDSSDKIYDMSIGDKIITFKWKEGLIYKTLVVYIYDQKL